MIQCRIASAPSFTSRGFLLLASSSHLPKAPDSPGGYNFGLAIVQTSAIGLETARRIQRFSDCAGCFLRVMDDAREGKISTIAVPIITDRVGVFFMPLEDSKPMVCEVRGVKGLYLRENKPTTGKYSMVEARGAMEHARAQCVGFIHLWKESGFETYEA